MKPDNVGAILFQFKNDHRYATTIYPSLLDGMDSYDLGFLNEEGDADVPIFRVVLALAGRVTCLKARPPPSLEVKVWNTQASKAAAPPEPKDDGEMKVLNSGIRDAPPPPEPTLPHSNPSSAPDSDDQENRLRMKKFTAYDIWCSGLASEVYALVTKKKRGRVGSYLMHIAASQRWKETYETGDDAHDQLRKAQNPGAASDLGFFPQWVSGNMHDVATNNI